MELDLRGKRALVTGASYGLGYFCAQALAAEGVSVVLCSRDAERSHAAAASITEQTQGSVLGVPADLRNEADIESLVSTARNALGGIDILVLSTGHPPTVPFSRATDELWLEGQKIILQPVIRLTSLLLPSMREQGFGRLLYIGSIFGLEPEQSSVIQSTFRTGLNAFAKCVATEAAADGVTANVLCPGYIETPLVIHLAAKYAKQKGVSTEAVIEEWKNFAPVRSFGKPEDFGAFVTFLASPRAAFITGTTLTIDGGALKGY